MSVASPVVSSASMMTPLRRGLPLAVSNRAGMPLRKRPSAAATSTPMTESCGPVMPTSVRYAVPFGRMRSSAVCTCVCVPTTAVTLPSRCQPIAIFSDVASAWKSTKTMRARCFTFSISFSTPANGSSMLSMNTRPIALTTPTLTPDSVRAM